MGTECMDKKALHFLLLMLVSICSCKTNVYNNLRVVRYGCKNLYNMSSVCFLL
jgi:hypothetical protein